MIDPIELENILQHLTDKERSLRLETAEQIVPAKSGLYSIFVDSIYSLPSNSIFKEELELRETNLLYVGEAKRSLKTRLFYQDLGGRTVDSSFFRSIGAVLGYRPERGSLAGRTHVRYVFSKSDKKKIVDWLNACARVSWYELEPEVLDECERYLIENLVPLFNLKHNHQRFKPLLAVRQECLILAKIVVE